MKCGGHSHSGQSTCDRGMMIDLSTSAACPWMERAPGVGQGRHVAGSGGWRNCSTGSSRRSVPYRTLALAASRWAADSDASRVARMSIDNLEAVDVVTADGKLRHASASENPDLFWGVRGGSGNFGVVTNFEFRLHPMQRQVIAGSLTFPIAKARDVMACLADYAPRRPMSCTSTP